jgi:hypothetical protein
MNQTAALGFKKLLFSILEAVNHIRLLNISYFDAVHSGYCLDQCMQFTVPNKNAQC